MKVLFSNAVFGGKRGREKGREIEIIFLKRELELGEKILLAISWAQGATFGAMLGGLVSQLSLTLVGSEQQNTWKKSCKKNTADVRMLNSLLEPGGSGGWMRVAVGWR